MKSIHRPVLLQEVLRNLDITQGKKYIDATFGGGGHSLEMIKRGGIVLAIDQDKEALERFKHEFSISDPQLKNEKNLILVQGNFKDIQSIAKHNGFEKVDGILFDLGLSSDQLVSGRGFSFLRNDMLDMRMDMSDELTAKEILNTWSEKELREVFAKFGEEEYAARIALEIVERRKKREVETTKELADLVSRVKPKIGKINPATKVFMALRIVVNNEIYNLKEALGQALELLDKSGRMAVISFHSLEDRVVKRTFLEFEEDGKGIAITKKPVVAQEEEIVKNLRARSAKLRVFEKL